MTENSSSKRFGYSPAIPIVIPARLNSSRLPGKLILNRTGCPLIAYSIRIARHAARVSDGIIPNVIVASDSDLLIDFAMEEDVETFQSREQHLSGTSRVVEFIDDLARSEILNLAGVIILQADQVGLDPLHLVRVARLLKGKNGEEYMITLSSSLDSLPIKKQLDPHVVKVLVGPDRRVFDFSRDLQLLSKRQTKIMDSTIEMHVGVYGYTGSSLKKISKYGISDRAAQESLEQLSALETDIKVLSLAIPYSAQLLSINTIEDYEHFVEVTANK
ncbi:3-deoxy-manno-octulosonate cytidylyltransferase [Polystyrenella longa]|uniref:3-deoxy-manno-octulosonate cytidylyltransferase n=1 Tax=Polystyrenella longa TaxID=2528007 RepID=A0A518CTM5_9PLAN|nr:hypothetical protein [Polystyrenella longa]QDU82524.1 3-deoxy-manno-octulosonate cytidylyltransferase [Polystyrenella longa]